MPATAQIRISADTAQFNKAMADVHKQMGKLSSIADKTSSTISMLFNKLKLVSGASVVGLGAGLVTSERQYRKFEKNMMEVFTLLPKGNKEMFEKLKDDALKFSSEFGRLPEEVASGMYQTLSAGISTNDANEFLEVAQKSAIAGVTDLRTAVDALTNVLNAYGTSTYDVGYIADQMFTAVSMSKTTFRELADYMYQIIPTAAAMKIRIDDLMGSISALAATGTLTRVGTTQLRQFLIELSRTGDKANAAFMQGTGGMPIQEFIKNGGRLTEVIKILGDTAKRRRTDLRNLFSSVEAGNAALTLYNSANYQGMMDTLENDSAGSMNLAFGKMASTMQFRLDRILRSTMNGFIRLGDVMKPMFDDILTYFEGIAEKIESYKWEELSRQFNIVWYKIKQAVQTGTFWDIFTKGAELSFVKISSFLQTKIRPALTEVTDQLALLISGDYDIGGAVLNTLKGIGNYLLSLIKDLSIALIDAFKSPIAFLASGMESALKNLLDRFYESLPSNLKSLLGIKGKAERQRDKNREMLGQQVQTTDIGDEVQRQVLGDKARSAQDELRGLQAELDLINKIGPRINLSQLSDKELKEKYNQFLDPAGQIQESKMIGVGDVLKQYRLDRGDVATHKRELEKRIKNIQEVILSSANLPSAVDGRAFVEKQLVMAKFKGGVGIEEQYQKATGQDLYEGLDQEEITDFLDGRMSRAYEVVLDRLKDATELSDLPYFSPIKPLYEKLLERRNAIFDNAIKFSDEISEASLGEATFIQKYKEYTDVLQRGVNELRKLQLEGGDEKEVAIQQIEANLRLLREGYDSLKKDAEKFEGTSPEAYMEKMGFDAAQRLKVKALEKQLQDMLDNLGVPKPRVGKEGAKNEDVFTRGQGGEDLSVGKAYAQPVVDSMQKIGGGGNAFTGLSQAGLEVEKMLQDRKNAEAAKIRNQRLINAMSELTQAIKGVNITKNKKEAIKSEAQAIAIDSDINGKTIGDTIVKILESAYASKETKDVLSKSSSDLTKEEGSYILELFRQFKSQPNVNENTIEGLAKYERVVMERLKRITSDISPKEEKQQSKNALSQARQEGREYAQQVVKTPMKETQEQRTERAYELKLNMMDVIDQVVDLFNNPESSKESKDFALKTIDELGGNSWTVDKDEKINHDRKEKIKEDVHANALALEDLVARGQSVTSGNIPVDEFVEQVTNTMQAFKQFTNQEEKEENTEVSVALPNKKEENTEIPVVPLNKKGENAEVPVAPLNKKEKNTEVSVAPPNNEVQFVIQNIKEFRDSLSYNFRDLTKSQREGMDMKFDKDASRKERVIEFNRLSAFMNAINNIEGAPDISKNVLMEAKALVNQPQYDSNVASKMSEAANHLESASNKLENRIESFIEGDFSQ